jgi:hypothetical protein
MPRTHDTLNWTGEVNDVRAYLIRRRLDTPRTSQENMTRICIILMALSLTVALWTSGRHANEESASQHVDGGNQLVEILADTYEGSSPKMNIQKFRSNVDMTYIFKRISENVASSPLHYAPLIIKSLIPTFSIRDINARGVLVIAIASVVSISTLLLNLDNWVLFNGFVGIRV